MGQEIQKKFEVVGLEDQGGAILLKLRELPRDFAPPSSGEASEVPPRVEISPLPKTEMERVAFELLDAMKKYGVPLPTFAQATGLQPPIIIYPQVTIWLSREEYERLSPRIGDTITAKMELMGRSG